MAIIILPDAQAQLLALQEYMLNNWSEDAWLKAEDEIFEKLENLKLENQKLTELRDWLLPMLMNGQVKAA